MTDDRSGLSRRSLLGAAGVGALAAGAAGGYAVANSQTEVVPDTDELPVDFSGRHQAGIVTPAQDRMYFVALDMTTEKRDDLVAMLQEWTVAARKLVEGLSLIHI